MRNCLFLFLLLIMAATANAQSPRSSMQLPFDKEFKDADSLMNNGLPQSAAQLMQGVYSKAKSANHLVQMLKAQLYMMQAGAQYLEGADTANIRTAVYEAKNSEFPYNSIWHSIAAQLYHQYYQQHQWQILQRTTIKKEGRQPIETWDAPHFFRVIAQHYDASLENVQQLKNIDLTTFASLLQGNQETRHLRPTLFDLLAFRAVAYYSSEVYGITQPAYQFTINKPAYLAEAASFVKQRITSKDSDSRQMLALQLYQEILEKHLEDTRPDALIDADLQRLEFVYRHATFPDKKAVYAAALQHLTNKYPNNAIAAEASYRILALTYERPAVTRSGTATKEKKQRDLVDLKAALEIIARRFPKSEGGVHAQALINEIVQPNLSVQSEEVILPDEYSKVLVSYKNIPQVWGRILRLNEEEYKRLSRNADFDGRKMLLAANPVQSFNQKMPAADDYETHTVELPVSPLNAGIYALLISADASFADSNNNLSYVLFQASNISFITQQGKANGFVLHRKTGKPLAGAQIEFYSQEWKQNKYSWVKKATAQSAADGAFEVNSKNLYTSQTVVHYGKEVLYANAGIYQYGSAEKAKATTQTFFFTDRSIYRPGQTIYFKGITVRKEPDATRTTVVPNVPTTVRLEDVNGQLIRKLSLTSNEFGSISGSFIAPQGGLTGNMQISNDLGSVYVSVEEYKRPRYEVAFDTLKSGYALNEKITVTGAANAYAGNLIDGATVKYRVVRETRWPYPWLYRRIALPASADMEITNGAIQTDATGTFRITFTAQPDESVDTALQPIFSYTVYADVVDIAGEARSASQTVNVGYRSIQITAAIPAQATPKILEKLPVRITNLNGQPLVQKASISIAPLIVPAQIMRARLWAEPELYLLDAATFCKQFPLDEYHSESKPEEWKPGASIYQQTFTSNEEGTVNIPAGVFKAGWYLVTITVKDKSSGADVTEQKRLYIAGSNATSPLTASLDQEIYEPGQTARAKVSSGFKDAYILQQENKGQMEAQTSVLALKDGAGGWTHAITERDRGGIALQWLMVKDNRVYTASQTVNIPWSNKELSLTWGTHRDKLAPGAKETWTMTIKGNKKEKVAAEMLAGLYDASLDAFKPHRWDLDGLFATVYSYDSWSKEGGFGLSYNRQIAGIDKHSEIFFTKEYEKLMISAYSEFHRPLISFRSPAPAFRTAEESTAQDYRAKQGSAIALGAARASNTKVIVDGIAVGAANADSTSQNVQGNASLPANKSISLRKNLQETAFFFPQLKTDANGDIQFSFTLPEALTEWKFMALAHTRELAVGQLTGKVKTQKDLMVQPNLPRFFRQGDDLILSTKISNLSDASLNGTAALEIIDAQTLQSVNLPFRLKENKVTFNAAKGQSTTASWRILIPESRYEPVLIRITAQAGSFSDGEENMLPVLTNRTLVTETLPLWMNGVGTQNYHFEKLLHSDTSKTLAQHRLTVEYTANPAWYAVQALPYLMEYPYECAEQTFNRYYANALAAHVLDQAPRVKEIFAQWKHSDTTALQSNLQKNQELKSALLEETPWVMEAKDEAAQRHNIALLFDSYKLGNSQDKALQQLEDMLLPEGAFPWFKGGGPDRYITQYIATGIARLQHLGITSTRANALQQKMIAFLDRQIVADYDALIKAKAKLDEEQISYIQAQYLYLRSFQATALPDNKTAFNYYRQQAARYWPKFNPYLKGMIALSLSRLGDSQTPRNIIQSLRETAVHHEASGMYWMQPNVGYWWYEAPIEAQSLLVECFHEVAKDEHAVDELKRWLLKQKQTQNWKTTKATADACYALLLQGTQWLNNTPTVSVQLGSQTIKPAKMEAGTGYFKQSFGGGQVTPEMGNITLATSQPVGQSTNQPGYGAVYWQYFENYDKITTAATPLALRKQLFIERNTDRGPVLEELGDGHILKLGDKVKVRIILQANRDMEYLHLKDMRAAAFEPLNVLSGYKWQGGLGYYESTRDASSNFFISYLPKGTYVFEYPVSVMARGNFSSGISTIQCMYAPEFTSHSEGARVHVE